jgi:hypothetical protein
MQFDNDLTLSVAFAGLRHLAQRDAELLVVVEDQTTAALVSEAVPPTRTLFISNLEQLGCRHLSPKQRRHSAATVIEILGYAQNQLMSSSFRDSCALLKAKLRGLVDRDICPTYSPRQALSGIAPPSKHARAISACASLRSTPLNDIEATFFVDNVSQLMDAASLLDSAQSALGLNAYTSADEAARNMIQEWLLPLFCVRSFLARQSPAISARRLPMLIGSWALPKLIASNSAERGIQIVKSVLPAGRLLIRREEEQLIDEIDAALEARELWPHLVHGHDLLRVLGMLHSFTRGEGAIPASAFVVQANESDSVSEGLRELNRRERALVDFARGKTSTMGNVHVADLIARLFG